MRNGFVDSNLLAGEEVVYRTRLHPVVYAPAFAIAVIGIVMILTGLTAGSDGGYLSSIGAIALLIALIGAASTYVYVATSEFAVTNRRVLIKYGWLRTNSFEILLQKVEGIGVDQGILGRILGYGTIGVRGTGGSREEFQSIAHPLEFRRQVQLLIPEQ